jgi:hypothetical protein
MGDRGTEDRNSGIEPENRGQRDMRGKSSGDGERRSRDRAQRTGKGK